MVILTKEKGIDIVVLDMPLLATRRGKGPDGDILSDIVLRHVLVAENERTNIRQRQQKEIAAASRCPLRQTPAPLPENFHHLLSAMEKWKITEQLPQSCAGCCFPPFPYRARFTKSCCCKQVFLQNCVDEFFRLQYGDYR